MMDPEDRRLLIEIHGSVKGIEPVLKSHGESIAKLEDRSRTVEIGLAEHGGELKRVKSDLDGLGRKVRAGSDRRRLEASTEDTGGKWLAFLEVLAALPKYAHVLLTIGSAVGMAAVVLWHHWPKGGPHGP